MKKLALLLVAPLLIQAPAQAAAQWVRTAAKVVTYPAMAIAGFTVGHIVGPWIGAGTGLLMWRAYWDQDNALYAAKQQAKADAEAKAAQSASDAAQSPQPNQLAH